MSVNKVEHAMMFSILKLYEPDVLWKQIDVLLENEL